jgi:DNA ligase-1
MAEFPILEGVSSNGKIKLWSIKVIDRDGEGVIETTFGYQGGKQQVIEKVISTGKNIGKRNETTPLEQALLDARTMWMTKKNSGYTCTSTSQSTSQSVMNHIEGGRIKDVDVSIPSPMLAHDYKKRCKSIQFPCYAQRKYDGVRCIGIPKKGLFSRNRKAYPNLDHLVEELDKLPDNLILDGELYSNKLNFQDIISVVKRETLRIGDQEKQYHIEFHVYDIINDEPYCKRLNTIQALFMNQEIHKFNHIKFVETELCQSEEHMKELHSGYVQEGYEGIMLRNKNGIYRSVRSADLLKFKEFIDDEYQIVDYRQGEGLEAGCVIWICQTKHGQVFNCRPRGSRDERMQLFLEGSKYIGKFLTVRMQELTVDGIPRFPVGITFRDYE